MLRRGLVLGGLFVVLAALGSVAWATTSASDKFVACARKSGGALRLVAAAKDCRKTERSVTWNQQGPRGVAGQDGLNGENGIDGEDGDDGVDGIDGDDGAPGPASEPKWKYVVTNNVAVGVGTPTISAGTCVAPTPQAVNGGVRLAGLPGTVRVTATAPVLVGTTASQWEVQVANTGGSAMVSTWVLCATGTAG
jgi:hypothetical protein